MQNAQLTQRGRLVGGILALTLILGAGVALAAAQSDRSGDIGSNPSPAASPSQTRPADNTPPRITVERPARPVLGGRPVEVRGKVRGASRVMVDGQPARMQGGGFSIRLTRPRPKNVVVARDRAGNESTKTLSVTIHRIPTTMHAVHVSAYGWSSRTLRRPLFKMIEEGRINAIEIDLKDESGIIGYDSKIPLAHRIGSDRGIYDLRQVIDRLHRLDVRVIGRLVAFRDPVLANWAWKHGHREQVIQTPRGTAYADYGGFTNFANASVRSYNVDIAEEAAKAGIDDVLYDYVRRPDGPRRTMVFKGLRETPERAIARFVRETEFRLRAYGTRVGASVFGIAATRPKEIAQDIPLIAKAADYVAPMLYPSHWAAGEYNVRNPNAQPYAIVARSLKDFLKDVKGTDVKIVPWIQDFSLGIHYGVHEVRAQLQAAASRGIKSWILWDPSVTYTSAALPRHDRTK
jgi:hypothetical protein